METGNGGANSPCMYPFFCSPAFNVEEQGGELPSHLPSLWSIALSFGREGGGLASNVSILLITRPLFRGRLGVSGPLSSQLCWLTALSFEQEGGARSTHAGARSFWSESFDFDHEWGISPCISNFFWSIACCFEQEKGPLPLHRTVPLVDGLLC